jgi:hypothetical protein
VILTGPAHPQRATARIGKVPSPTWGGDGIELEWAIGKLIESCQVLDHRYPGLKQDAVGGAFAL